MRRQILLVEYQKAQDSAEHHDELIWTVMSLNWIGSAVLLGFALDAISAQPTEPHKVALILVSIVGITLSVFVWRWTRQLRAVKNAKYERCKEIEQLLSMKQHSTLIWPPPLRGPKWIARLRQRDDYAILLCAFLATWVAVLAAIIRG